MIGPHVSRQTSCLREFVRTSVILTPAREASTFGTTLCQQVLQEYPCLIEFESPVEGELKLSVLKLKFETSIEVQPSQVSMAGLVKGKCNE